MNSFESPVSVCRHCQNYHLEGRRGGYCIQLSSLVQGCWKACSLAIPPFAPSWESHMGFKEEITQIFWKQQQSMGAVSRHRNNGGEECYTRDHAVAQRRTEVKSV